MHLEQLKSNHAVGNDNGIPIFYAVTHKKSAFGTNEKELKLRMQHEKYTAVSQ